MSFAIEDDGDLVLGGRTLVPLSPLFAAQVAARVALLARAPYGAGLSEVIIGSTETEDALVFFVTEAVAAALELAAAAQREDGLSVQILGVQSLTGQVSEVDPTRLDFTVEVALGATFG